MKDLLDAREEFKAFFILLQQNQWFSTISSTHELQKIFQSTHKNEEKWDYELSKFVFKNISLDRHIRPHIVSKYIKEKLAESSLIFELSCSLLCNEVNTIIRDPVVHLCAKFIIQFEYIDQEDGDLKRLQSSWHLDKHDPAKETSTTHPLYHYEFGGSEMTKSADFNYGDFVLLDSPRLMHPPLDLVLAFDFILKNFYNFNDHKVLTEAPQYKRYIRNAQYRLWRPFAISFASHFHDFSDLYKIDTSFAKNIIHCPNLLL